VPFEARFDHPTAPRSDSANGMEETRPRDEPGRSEPTDDEAPATTSVASALACFTLASAHC
jgi:hypothetical protein